MWVATVLHKPVGPAHRNPKFFACSLQKPKTFRVGFPVRPINFGVSAAKKQLQSRKPESEKLPVQDKISGKSIDMGWLPAFPHVLIASMSNFLFGYHIGVMNGRVVSIARELGFEGNPILAASIGVAPTKYRGSLGTLCQIGMCFGIILSLFGRIPAEDDPYLHGD